jgi:hypothetical protein
MEIEKMMRCDGIKIKQFEEDQKISITPGCSHVCGSKCESHCFSFKDPSNEPNSTYAWRVINYAHLSYAVLKYSNEPGKKLNSGLILFVDTLDTWNLNRAKFYMVNFSIKFYKKCNILLFS